MCLRPRAGALGVTLRVDAPPRPSLPTTHRQTLVTYAANDEQQATASHVIVYTDETGTGGRQYAYAAVGPRW